MSYITPSLNQRTIQHPGFEFVETDLSLYNIYDEHAQSLVIGFSDSGPVGELTYIDEVNDFISTFGQPTNDGEYYPYLTIKNILEAESTCYFLRLPYDNSLLELTEDSYSIKYKALKYNIIDSESPFSDTSFFTDDISYKNLECTPALVQEEELEDLSDCDFIICNKYNKTENSPQLFVQVLGSLNAADYQGLASEDTELYSDYTDIDSTLLFTKDTTEYEKETLFEELPYKLKSVIPTIATKVSKVDNTWKTYFNPNSTIKEITVIVGTVEKSIISGKYIFTVQEVFSGALNAGSINPYSKESSYIGDIINESSKYISFYGKTSYSNYTPKEDVLFVQDQIPYTLSVIDNGLISPDSEETFDLGKYILNSEHLDYNYTDIILKSALSKFSNYLIYNFSDIYDSGLSSILSTQYKDSNGNLIYSPKTDMNTRSEILDNSSLEYNLWQNCARIIGKWCKYTNRGLSMLHLDSPRKFVLNGDLSLVNDLNLDEDVIFGAERVELISIRDNCYSETNINWHQIATDFDSRKIWVPSSCLLAYNISYNDLNYYIWNPPAGIKYGVITPQPICSAVDLSSDSADIVYQKGINYSTKVNDISYNKIYTFAGQHTNSDTDYQINRISTRRLANYLKRYVLVCAAEYIGEANTTSVRDSFKSDLEEEFDLCVDLGGLEDYSINVGTDINTEESITAGELRAQIIIKPVSTVEFILADFVICKTGIKL